MLEVLGFLVLVLVNIWFSLFTFIVGVHGGLDTSSPFSRYGTWKERLGATVLIILCCYFWYALFFQVSPFTIVKT